ncbi:hypothetical protein SLEP1_g40543 [Rubroshorea leprosula]|uniref:Uncharacterized protein n=1 Tax=Rubroshorea leprosula TaxID=152421 RepID=A0AAV5L4L2_9ROSI|nr:hypothetical protein SLEP1_g40543 [Rubroshorea leprosula]
MVRKGESIWQSMLEDALITSLPATAYGEALYRYIQILQTGGECDSFSPPLS